MSKIICDICGTTYPSSSDCCPICGCTNADAADLLKDDVLTEDFVEEPKVRVAPKNRKKEIFDYDEVNTRHVPEEKEKDEDYDYEEDDEDDDEDEPRHNTFVVILLTVLIVALLGVAAFIFVRYFLPNMGEEEIVPTTVATMPVETTTAATEPTIPCEQMVMTNAGIAELNAEGQQFLLHIKPLPQNTTDIIIYTSADESIATVTEDGKITAVSEGETTIFISCGKTRIECPVIVEFVEETVPPTTEVVEETEAEEESTEETAPVEESDEEEPATEETKADTVVNSDVKLKLKRTDIQLGVYYSFQLELDCDLNPEDVTWTSEHPHIATVDEQGNVTAVKEGTTSVTAKYGDQEVKCMVRCIWY